MLAKNLKATCNLVKLDQVRFLDKLQLISNLAELARIKIEISENVQDCCSWLYNF